MDDTELKQHTMIVAKSLEEQNPHAIGQIELLIKHIGLEFVQDNLAEAQRIEQEGGLMTQKGDRRRTIGGVFFYVVKPKLNPEQRAIVFPPVDWKKLRDKKKKAKAVAKSEDVTDTSKQSQSDSVTQLQKLESAAQKLRRRLAEMEAKGQKGTAMTQRLLKNTEAQIRRLREVD